MTNAALKRIGFALTPRFWRSTEDPDKYATFGDYRPVFLLTIFLLTAASLIPLSVITVLDIRLTRRDVELEHRLTTERTASNAKRSVEYYLDERLDALDFTIREESYENLRNPDKLAVVLRNLKLGFGGISDLGVIDNSGRQVAYEGPYQLTGRDYSGQKWFLQTLMDGAYVSDVFLGYRDEPHIIVAVTSRTSEGDPFVLRATLDTERLTQRLRSFIGDEQEDIFLINRSGIVQTPSARHGGVLEKAAVEVPEYSERTRSFDAVDPTGEAAVFGYAYIPVKAKPNPFVLFFVKPKTLVEKELARVRLNRMLFLAGSGLTIVFTVVLISIFTFNHLYDADRSKAETMLRMEKAGRLASLGTLSAGIAHEINNPLAAIGQEAGYIKDLLSIDGSRPTDEELLEQIDSILESVFRCGRITRQLLRFAHQGNVDVQTVAIADAVSEVLAFFGKEAEYRNIEIQSSVSDEVPEIMTDRGRLQQILLNLVKNAVQAMVDGGTLLITARRHRREMVRIEVSDTGCGIPEEKLARIFEPFFTTKNQGEGTGLGLSLTYAMVRKLGGNIHVQSEVGKGSRFTVTLPIGVPRGVHENESSAR